MVECFQSISLFTPSSLEYIFPLCAPHIVFTFRCAYIYPRVYILKACKIAWMKNQHKQTLTDIAIFTNTFSGCYNVVRYSFSSSFSNLIKWWKGSLYNSCTRKCDHHAKKFMTLCRNWLFDVFDEWEIQKIYGLFVSNYQEP